MGKKVVIQHIERALELPVLNPGDSLLIGEDGTIEAVGSIEVPPDCTTIDARGMTLSPGWVDMHTHVFDGICDIAVEADRIGPRQGVTTLVDAGSAGHITYPGFRKYVIDSHPYEIFSFLNLGSAGIIRTNVIGDYETDDFIQPEETIKCINENRDFIKGVKVRACCVVLKGRDVEVVEQASQVAVETGLPLMVHVGEPRPYLSDILNVLREGDIVTHCFHGKPGGLFSMDDRMMEEALAAREKGVLFDIGHGGASFSFDVGKRALSIGFKPDLISTDLHLHNINGPVFSQALTMSKMLALGLPEEEIIQKVTTKPAEILKIEDLKRDPIGKKARFTLYSIQSKPVEVFDSSGTKISIERQFTPKYTVIGTQDTACGNVLI